MLLFSTAISNFVVKICFLIFQPPTDTIDLRMCSNKLVDVVPRMECSRPNTFELMVKRPLSKHDTPSLLSAIEGKEIHTK